MVVDVGPAGVGAIARAAGEGIAGTGALAGAVA